MAEDTSKPAGWRVVDGALALLQAVAAAVLFAAAVAALVYLLPGKFPILILSLYGFICVWMLQIATLLILALTLLRATVSETVRADTPKAILLGAGFLIAVALGNAYILTLAHLWGRSFATTVGGIPLIRFIGADQHVLVAAAAALAVIGDFLDHIFIALFHGGGPIAMVRASVSHVMAALASLLGGEWQRAAALGWGTGLFLAGWVHLAKGSGD